MHNRLKLGKEKREAMICAIQAYFLQERDEDLGQLAAGFILDFFLEKLAPEIYNQGIWDSHNYLSERLED